MPLQASRHADPFSRVGKPLPTSFAAGVPAHDVLIQFGWSNAAMLQVYTWDSAQERATAAFQKFFDEQGQR